VAFPAARSGLAAGFGALRRAVGPLDHGFRPLRVERLPPRQRIGDDSVAPGHQTRLRLGDAMAQQASVDGDAFAGAAGRFKRGGGRAPANPPLAALEWL